MLSSRLFLLSALWRPHSEQIKHWIAVSEKDAEGLSLARNYLHNLDLQNVLVTLDDGLELVDILPKIKYPHGSHALSYLAEHFEMTCNELTAQTVKQLSADARLAGGDLDHYEATLGSPSFLEAFSRSVSFLENLELTQLAFPFCTFVNRRGTQTKRVASRILQIIADELTRRLHESGDKASFLTFLATQNLPLETEQWDHLRIAVFTQTAAMDAAALQSLLKSIATHSTPNPNSAWGSAVQDALVKKGSISNSSLCDVVINVIRSGSPVDSLLINQIGENFQEFSAGEILSIMTAWKEAILRSSGREFFTTSSIICLQVCTETRLDQLLQPCLSGDKLLWVYCLSFFSASKAAAFLKLWYADPPKPPVVSANDAALLCKIMVHVDYFSPVLVRSVCAHAESNLLDQEESIAMLHVYQKAGAIAPQELVKKAVGRLGGRLVMSHSQDRKANSALSLNSLAVLLASLSFVDDEVQLTFLKRLLQLQQLTPAVAMAVLRYTQNTKTRTCQFTRAKIIKNLVQVARAFSAEEISFTMSVLAELRIRDAAVYEHLLRQLESKSPSIKNVIVAGKAAKTLRLSSSFEQLSFISTLHELPGISTAELFTILRCCGKERRRALLSSEKVLTLINTVPIAEIKTLDLVMLFSMCATNSKRREALAKVMAMRDPVMCHEIDADDVVDAFECAVTSHEVDSICKIYTRASQKLSEIHLMRLLRSAQGYSTISNKFYRFVGKVILSLSSNGRLSPNNALLWTKFYCDHQIMDDSVGRCLVMRAGRTKNTIPPDLCKALQKAAKFYGITSKMVTNLAKPQSNVLRKVIERNMIDNVS